MEIIQAFAGAFVAILIVAAVAQVLVSYSLQVIAEKNELPDFASFIAWIPLLNIYPFIKVGGGDFKKLLLGGLALIVGFAVIAGGSAAAGVGGAGTGIAGAVVAVVTIVYFARIAMGTAERRGLSKWLGLLTFVPLANFMVYPYIAFHDGFKAPNKAGLVLGLLLAFGPLPGQIALIETMSQQAQEVAQADLGDGVSFQQAMGSLGATIEISTGLAMLDSMDPSDPNQAASMMETIAELQSKLETHREAIGPEAYEELAGQMNAQSQRMNGMPSSGMQNAIVQDDPTPAQRVAQSPPAGPPLTSSVPRNGDRGFEVPVNPGCPPGAAQRSSDQGSGAKAWCEKVGVDAGIKHGWMTEYHSNGVAAVAGEYRDGLRVGVWTRYHDNGVMRVQAEFVEGLQDGVLISWGQDGTKIYEKHFSQGAPASR